MPMDTGGDGHLSPFMNDISETLQGVLGSGENGVQKYREHGARGQKDQGA